MVPSVSVVLAQETIAVPDKQNPGRVVSFCIYPVMSAKTVPPSVALLFSREDERADLFASKDDNSDGTSADDRTLVHINVFSSEEMRDLPAALSHRLEKLGGDYDLFVVGNGETPETSDVLALFIAEK